jgi:hypothetical protein
LIVDTPEEGAPRSFGSAFRELDRRVAESLGRSDLGKSAAHAHDRMQERTDLHPSYVDLVQRAVDTLSLPKGSYHLPLRNQDGSVHGYAQFKGVPNRKAPVLATILGPKMRPGGQDIEAMIKLNHFVEADEMRAPVGKLERPGREEGDRYTTDRAFKNLEHATGLVIERGT